jgi:heme exporter protein CcmD
MPWVIAAYAVTGLVLLGYALHLRVARRAALRDQKRRG